VTVEHFQKIILCPCSFTLILFSFNLGLLKTALASKFLRT
jgi:hypothetical protein